MPSALESFTDLRVADSKGRVLLGSRYAGERLAVREEADGTIVLTPMVVDEREKPSNHDIADHETMRTK